MRCAALSPANCLLWCTLLVTGCGQKPKITYVPLTQAGFSVTTIDDLKKLKITESEIPQIVKLKTVGLTDDTSLALVKDAHSHQHSFSSGDSAGNLIGAGYSEQDVLNMAQSDQLDAISTEAITLKLIGLSQATVQMLVSRHLQGLPTLSSAEISRLINTGLSEKQVLERIDQGMTDEQAEKEVAAREAKRNHANTDFVRTRAKRR
jgi:hypothetical protein